MPGTTPPAVSQTTAATVAETAGQAAPVTIAPAPKAASLAKTPVNPYPYVTSELRRIAILGAIIIVILVVLSIVLT
jgi:hypothetical protein